MMKNAKPTLAQTNRKLAREWHPTKNSPLTPKDVTAGSSKKVWWMCRKSHKWEAPPNRRNRGSGCPYCAGQKVCKDNCLRTLNPKLAREWHPTRNAQLTPKNVTAYSNKKVWWICKKGHAWQACIGGRNLGSRCPYCSGNKAHKDNCLRTLNPKLAQEWHPSRNARLRPKDVTAKSHKKVWWMCRKGHAWQANISNRNRGAGCPYCSGHRACKDNCIRTVNPKLAREWHPTKNAPWSPKDVASYSQRQVWWKCKKGHELRESVRSRYKRGGCPVCVLELHANTMGLDL